MAEFYDLYEASKEEFLKSENGSKFQKLFTEIDSDSDGSISAAELESYHVKQCETMNKSIYHTLKNCFRLDAAHLISVEGKYLHFSN